MIDVKQLRELIIIPVLERLGMCSDPAIELVFETGAQESRYRWIHQLGRGPAKGFWQMEPFTHDDIWQNWIRYQPEVMRAVRSYVSAGNKTEIPDADEMVFNMAYACAMCRIHYRRIPVPLPETRQARAEYWKKYYNTYLGRGTTGEYIAQARRMDNLLTA